MTKLTLATIIGACAVTGTVGTIAVTSVVKNLPQKSKPTTTIAVPIDNMANSVEDEKVPFTTTVVTTKGTTMTTTGVTTAVTTTSKGTETTVATTTVTGDNGTDKSAPNSNTNNTNEEKANPSSNETPSNNNEQPTQNEQPREEVKPVEQPKAEEPQQRVEEVKPVEQPKVEEVKPVEQPKEEEPVQQSNPKDGLNVIFDNGGSGIAKLSDTTYGLYIDNWTYCRTTFEMPTPDMKWYNETQDVINTAKAEGKSDYDAFKSGAWYYVSRMYYNEDLDVMYEDGIVWVYSISDDCYRSSSVTY